MADPTYSGPHCQVGGCSDPATQKAAYRGTTPPFGDVTYKELCQAHALLAASSECPPYQLKPLSAWANHQRKLAAKAEEDERAATMAAQQRWDI